MKMTAGVIFRVSEQKKAWKQQTPSPLALGVQRKRCADSVVVKKVFQAKPG
jgi:hypothetical protein